MRTIVTGAQGFIGRHIFQALDGDRVGMVRDVNSQEYVPAIYALGDLRDRSFVERVITQYEPDSVIHAASSAIVSQSQLDPYNTYTSNVVGTLNLLEACARLRKKPYFQHLSTDKVLGEGDGAREDKPYAYAIEGPYEQSKIMQEILVLRYSRRFPVCVVRSCNVYGPGDWHKRIVPNMIKEAIEKGTVTIFKEREPTHRQYIYVGDLVDAMAFLRVGRTTGICHVGTPAIANQTEIANSVLLHFSGAKIVTAEDNRGPEIKVQSLNWDRIKSMGWSPKNDLGDGIGKTVNWWRERP